MVNRSKGNVNIIVATLFVKKYTLIIWLRLHVHISQLVGSKMQQQRIFFNQ